MIQILVDPDFTSSIWCQKLLDDLTDQLKQKRLDYHVIHSIQKLHSKTRYVFLIGSDHSWIQPTIASCNRLGITPIWLCNMSSYQIEGEYHVVCTDITRSMRKLIDSLRASGKKRIGLYGCNPNSVTDQGKCSSFLSLLGPGARNLVFENQGDLAQCYASFLPLSQQVDALICCNGFAAVALVHRLKKEQPQILERLHIIACTDTRLPQLYPDQIHMVRNRSGDYGRAAVALLDTLKRSPFLSHIMISLQWDIPSVSLEALPPVALPAAPSETDPFYLDPQIQQMMPLEKLLLSCSKTDRMILRLLHQGASYPQIAEKLFLSLNTVKYHVRKMLRLCGIPTKKALISLLCEFVPEESCDLI